MYYPKVVAAFVSVAVVAITTAVLLRSPRTVTEQHQDAVVRWLDEHGRAGKRDNVTCVRHPGEVEDSCSITYMGLATDSGTIHGVLLKCSDTAKCYPVGGW